MKRLKKYKTASFLNVEIQYGDDVITYNLFEELQINEAQLQDEIKHQPSLYGFLLMLNKKLNTEFETLKQERKALYGRLYLKGKKKMNGGRPYNDDMAKAYAESHPKYQKITEECIMAKDKADAIFSGVMGFQQRASLLQTLSSNLRKEV